ncbi:MAG: hypothetical protein M5U16_01230 [Hyphomicrobium sp.]|nr:hypothetical protein [Hyphomicrobium sp.]
MASIYLAAYEIALGQYHVYLVNDQNDNLATTLDQLIIRGGPEFPGLTPPWGDVAIENGVLSADSVDGLDNMTDVDGNGYAENDKNEDGVVDTYIDRNYTQIFGLSWTQLTDCAADLVGNTFDYNPLGKNSNSVIATILSKTGYDYRDLLPSHLVSAAFPGDLQILDSAESETFRVFSSNDDLYTFHDRAGADTIIVENGARLEIVKDDDPNSTNKVVLLDQNLLQLSLASPFGNDDLEINSSVSGLALVTLGDQYGTNGLAADTLQVWGENDALLKSLNLAAIPENEAFGALSEFFTAFDYTVVPDGHIVRGSGNEDQTDRLYGLDGQNDLLIGAAGADSLKGGTGTDTYVWNLGDGGDTIHDDWAENDVLSFGPGITSGMLGIGTSGSDIRITIDPGVYASFSDAGFGGTITIKNQAANIATFAEPCHRPRLRDGRIHSRDHQHDHRDGRRRRAERHGGQ